MKTFIDWAGQPIFYKLKKEPLHEDSQQIVWRCYAGESLDYDFHPMGSGDTRKDALKDAIDYWNWSDTVGRG